jgi:hypothetical protein
MQASVTDAMPQQLWLHKSQDAFGKQQRHCCLMALQHLVLVLSSTSVKPQVMPVAAVFSTQMNLTKSTHRAALPRSALSLPRHSRKRITDKTTTSMTDIYAGRCLPRQCNGQILSYQACVVYSGSA